MVIGQLVQIQVIESLLLHFQFLECLGVGQSQHSAVGAAVLKRLWAVSGRLGHEISDSSLGSLAGNSLVVGVAASGTGEGFHCGLGGYLFITHGLILS